VLEAELRQQRIQQLGPRSETLSNLQHWRSIEEEPGITREEVEAESPREPLTPTPGRSATLIRAWVSDERMRTAEAHGGRDAARSAGRLLFTG
jgi:hypothetical protein